MVGLEQVTLTADTAPERPHLPWPEALRDDLLLADRGYFDRESLGAVDRAGGYFVMRARHGLGDVFRVLARGRRRGFLPVLRNLVDYLASNATRSHPKRDRKKGRLQFGLEPVL